MNNSPYKSLEFERVLEDLARRTHCCVSAARIEQLTPLPTIDDVRSSLGVISEISHFLDSGGVVPMDSFTDVRSYLKSAAAKGAYLDSGALAQIHRLLELAERLQSFFHTYRNNFSRLKAIARQFESASDLIREIARAIDLRTLAVQDHASQRLWSIRRHIVQARERVRRELEHILDRLAQKEVLQERLITMRSDRFVVPVKDSHKHAVPGVLHDRSASGATVYLEPLAVVELNNTVRRLESDERNEIEAILRALTDLVRQHRDIIDHNFDLVVTIDCIHAKALASRALHESEPEIGAQGELVMRGARHPLLMLKAALPTQVIPLDLSMDPGVCTLVITGPNAGGKTVALKTVGLISLMVSCGLHVPVHPDSKIPVFRHVFANIGDAQSIDMDLSTFSAHIQRINSVVEQAESTDLVLIDEIGTGTDPLEGAALAMAVLELLTKRKVMTIVTTHHGALKAFAHETPGMSNGSMVFDADSLQPTYRYKPHLPGASYALEIAQRTGLPQQIIDRARSFVGTQANKLEALLLDLEQQAEKAKELESRMQFEWQAAVDARQRAEQELARLRQEADATRRKAALDAETLLRGANAALEEAIKHIREQGASREAIGLAKALVREQKDVVLDVLEAEVFEQVKGSSDSADVVSSKPVGIGDRVLWARTRAAGSIISETDSSGAVLVAFGNMKARVPVHELTTAASSSNDAQPYRLKPGSFFEPRQAWQEIDVRGMRVEEALTVVDKVLDDALLAGLDEISIIHGMGTGALRSGLSQFLKTHRAVKSIRAGERPCGRPGSSEGLPNPGVTIVELAGRE